MKDDKKTIPPHPAKRDFEGQEKQEEKKEIVELKKQNEELENKYKRALADYQNLEKRAIEERKNWIVTANKELILRILPVLDTLMLANQHAAGDEGLELSIRQFLNVLKTEGVIRIETENKEFNPELMECVGIKKGEDGKVLSEARAGYMLDDKVLKPAQVIVGKKEIDKKEEELAKEQLQKGDYM